MVREKPYTFEDVLDALRRRRWWVIVPAWIVALAAILFIRTLPDRYDSQVQVRLIPPRVIDSSVRGEVPSNLEERLPGITARVLNADRLRQIVDQFGLYTEARREPGRDLAALFRRDLRVQIVPPDIVRLVYTATDPHTALAVTTQLGSALVEENRRDSAAVTSATSDFLESQLDEARHRLETQEQEIEEYRRKHAGELPSQLDSNVQVLQSTETRLQAARAAMDRDQSEASLLDRLIADLESRGATANTAVTGPAPATGGPAAGPATLTDRVESTRKELRALQLRLKPDHPDVAGLERRLADLEREAAAALAGPTPSLAAPSAQPRQVSPDEARSAELRLRRQELTRTISNERAETVRLQRSAAEYQRRIEAAPARETELEALTRDHDTLQDFYTKLLARQHEAQMAGQLQTQSIGDQFVIVDAARLPEAPAAPNRLQLNSAGVFAGLLVGLGLAAFREFRDSTVRTDRDVTAFLGLSVLAAIPTMPTRSERRWRRAGLVSWSLAGMAGLVVTAAILWQTTH
jgi:polysaccharide chain length determinant protein (PEP-CTERM system associated)